MSASYRGLRIRLYRSIRNIATIFIFDLKKYYSKAPVISWGILFPLTIILVLGTGYGVFAYSRIVPVGFTIAVLFASTSIVHVSVSFEKMNGSINQLLFLPISSSEIVFAKIAGGVLYGFLGSLIAGITYYYITGGIAFIHPHILILGVFLGSLVFSFIALIVVILYEPIKAIAVLNIVRFTMLFIGGLIIPKPLIPSIIRPIVYVFPSVYVYDTCFYGLYNEYQYTDPYTALIVLTVVVITLCYVSIKTTLYTLRP